MADTRDRHREVYREEAYELLSELEESLLELEERPEDAALVGRVFRALHTIKGSGSMFGFEEVASFTHEVETAFDIVRNGKVVPTRELVDIALKCRDHILKLLDASTTGEFVDEAESEALVSALRVLLPEEEAAVPYSAPEDKEGKSPGFRGDAYDVTYRISFRPPGDLFLKGVNPAHLLDDLRKLGYCYVVAQNRDVPEIGKLDPEHCYVYWDVILTTRSGINAIRDVFIFVEDDSRLRIDVVDEGGYLSDETDYKRLGEILVERGDVKTEDLLKILGQRKKIGEMLVDYGLVENRQVESALTEQEYIKEKRKERREKEAAATIRVPSAKLDSLVDLVGELVTVQARLSQKASVENDPELLAIAEEVERLTSELHDSAMSVRMVPIGSTFSRFKRLVRDLSVELGREVVLETAGAETELDKTVIERLGDPLVHLIRNSIGHGIEPSGERTAAGKPGQGKVLLSASHSGAHVLVEVKDDGAGLDAAAIRAKAAEMGLIQHDAELSDEDLFNLVFTPGFSTARKVTGVSGRGVGMDVVKKAVEDLRGSVAITSKKGFGTTVMLAIPLTLAIVDGLLVKLGQDFFVLPLSSVEECVELSVLDVDSAHGRDLVNVRGEMVPYIPLRKMFGINGDAPELQQVVIVMNEGLRVGFAVDQVIGEHQTVIKSLGRFYRGVEGISGATILGDGTVALILDVPRLVHGASLKERQSVENM